MSDKFTKNASITTIEFEGQFMTTRRNFVTHVRGDKSEMELEQLFALCTREMRSQLRAEEVRNASMWAVAFDSIRTSVESVAYEITNAEFMRIAIPILRTEQQQYFMVRSISNGTVEMTWQYFNESGVVYVTAPCDPADMDETELEKWYISAVKSARGKIAKQLAKSGREEKEAKSLAKLITPQIGAFSAGESGLYGVTYDQLQPYRK